MFMRSPCRSKPVKTHFWYAAEESALENFHKRRRRLLVQASLNYKRPGWNEVDQFQGRRHRKPPSNRSKLNCSFHSHTWWAAAHAAFTARASPGGVGIFLESS